ncbi:MAG: hypothetical protein ABI175_28745, partial [Polyangiales bacterium]
MFELGAAAEQFRAWAIAAAYDLGVFDALAVPRTLADLAAAIGIERGVHRLHALVAALVHAGVLVQDGERIERGAVPGCP